MKRRTALALSLPVLAVALAGCGSGRHNENYSEVSAINGAIYHAGGLGIYNTIITVPAGIGGKTNVLFSLYADSPADANQLRSVTANSISGAPATLSQVTNGNPTPVEAVTVNHQFGPGSTLTQASFSDLTAPVVPGGYYNVTFSFASGLVTTIHVPVAQNGAFNPNSTVPPSSIPEQPYVANSNAPLPNPCPQVRRVGAACQTFALMFGYAYQRSIGTLSSESRRGAAKGGYRCGECGATAARWVGRCRECQAWGTVTEAVAATNVAGLRSGRVAGVVTTAARPVADIELGQAAHVPTGIGELDRVLGGGLVPGSVVLLAGEPGVGKSTLLLAVAAASARAGRRALVVTGEESAAQVRLRAERTGCVHDELWLAAETDLAAVLAHVDEVQPALLIVDSVQTVASSEIDGSAGGVTQVREVSAALTRMAKERNIATVLVGHVTKDGALAGPRVLEHLVDVVLHAEGDRHSTLRMVRAVKNRYGAADEVGCFEQDDTGLREVTDPSGLFLSRSSAAVAGTCVTITMEGRRALPAEVQALLGERVNDGTPNRRVVSGLDSPRIQVLTAVVAQRLGVPLGGRDVYLSTVGGVRVTEPAADLAVALALASAADGRALPVGLVAMGEVALSGEVRRVPGIGRRLAEAGRMGFTVALVPADSGPLPQLPPSLRVVEVATIRDALLATAPSQGRGRAASPRRE